MRCHQQVSLRPNGPPPLRAASCRGCYAGLPCCTLAADWFRERAQLTCKAEPEQRNLHDDERDYESDADDLFEVT